MMRELLKWLGFVGAKVDTRIDPRFSTGAIPAGAGSAGWVNTTAPPGGMDDLQVEPESLTEFAQAEIRFREDLPRLLQQEEKFGWWVVYSPRGYVEDAAEEGSLWRKYRQQIGQSYFLARIVPDPPEAEVTPNWFVTIEREPHEGQ
jgi:hypothetical protein